jgi:RNA polymerase sigma-70 factor (ECF subfamily)
VAEAEPEPLRRNARPNGEAARGARAQRPAIGAAQLERIYAGSFSAIYGFVYAQVGNREDAEDITAQVFLKGLQYLDPTAAPQEIQAYLFRVARTNLAEHWRRYLALRIAPIDEEPAALDDPPEVGAVATPALVAELERILALLPPNYRRVLELRFYEGRSIKETARIMNVSVANAKVLQYRAIQRAAAYAQEGDSGR